MDKWLQENDKTLWNKFKNAKDGDNQIIYQLVNMPALISGDFEKSKRFIEMIKDASDNDVSYLDNEAIQIVIDYKWVTYTKKTFLN